MNIILDEKEAIDILRAAKIKRDDTNRPCIDIGGHLYRLCRTDYKDDVCTFSHDDARESDEAVRNRYLGKISWLGVRLKNGSFRVIDSFTDG